jgi:hypothetical protein
MQQSLRAGLDTAVASLASSNSGLRDLAAEYDQHSSSVSRQLQAQAKVRVCVCKPSPPRVG